MMVFDNFKIIQLDKDSYAATPAITYDRIIKNSKKFSDGLILN